MVWPPFERLGRKPCKDTKISLKTSPLLAKQARLSFESQSFMRLSITWFAFPHLSFRIILYRSNSLCLMKRRLFAPWLFRFCDTTQYRMLSYQTLVLCVPSTGTNRTKRWYSSYQMLVHFPYMTSKDVNAFRKTDGRGIKKWLFVKNDKSTVWKSNKITTASHDRLGFISIRSLQLVESFRSTGDYADDATVKLKSGELQTGTFCLFVESL